MLDTHRLARGTVRKYAEAPSFPERAPRRGGPSIIDPHIPHPRARLAAGCTDAALLWREVKARGYPGGARQVRRWLTGLRTEPARTAPHRWRGRAPETPGSNGGSPASLPAPRRLAWLLTQPLAGLTPADAIVVARVERDADAATVAELARGFTSLVRARGIGNK